MALDYSKLSDEELEALEKGDYSKLSEATLQALANEPKAAPAAPVAPVEPYVTQAEADRNELLGAGAAVLGAGGLGYGAYKLAPAAVDIAKRVSPTARVASAALDVAKNVMTQMPAAAPATSPILDAQGRPMVRTPVAPSAPAPAPQAQPSIMDKASQMVRQLAANRVVQGAAKIGVGATAALMPGNVGQDYPFPQSGPMRGQEINPGTGRPWTKQELDAYRAQYGG